MGLSHDGNESSNTIVPAPGPLLHMLEIVSLPFLFLLFILGIGLILSGEIILGAFAMLLFPADLIGIALLIKNRHSTKVNKQLSLSISMNAEQRKRYNILKALTVFAVFVYLIGMFIVRSVRVLFMSSVFMGSFGLLLIVYTIYIEISNAQTLAQKIKFIFYGFILTLILFFSLTLIYIGFRGLS